jgi:hypothetical protein
MLGARTSHPVEKLSFGRQSPLAHRLLPSQMFLSGHNYVISPRFGKIDGCVSRFFHARETGARIGAEKIFLDRRESMADILRH